MNNVSLVDFVSFYKNLDVDNKLIEELRQLDLVSLKDMDIYSKLTDSFYRKFNAYIDNPQRKIDYPKFDSRDNTIVHFFGKTNKQQLQVYWSWIGHNKDKNINNVYFYYDIKHDVKLYDIIKQIDVHLGPWNIGTFTGDYLYFKSNKEQFGVLSLDLFTSETPLFIRDIRHTAFIDITLTLHENYSIDDNDFRIIFENKQHKYVKQDNIPITILRPVCASNYSLKGCSNLLPSCEHVKKIYRSLSGLFFILKDKGEFIRPNAFQIKVTIDKNQIKERIKHEYPQYLEEFEMLKPEFEITMFNENRWELSSFVGISPNCEILDVILSIPYNNTTITILQFPDCELLVFEKINNQVEFSNVMMFNLKYSY